jgi:hypothetical protein
MNTAFINKENRMKYVRYILLTVVISAAITGCNKDLLDTVPNDRLSTELYWKTDQDAILASNAIYASINTNGAERFFSLDGMSDIAHSASNPGSANQVILLGKYDALNSRVLSEWTNAYAGIRAANTFLLKVDQVQTLNAAQIARLKAEVRALRAYHYLTLVSLFGDVPIVTTELTLEESKTVTRQPVAQVYDFIVKELTEAAAVLPNVQTEKGRFTKGAALGFKARAQLWAGRYADAAASAKQVMDLNVYSIYPSYEKLFTYAAENSSEVIFDIQFVKDTYRNNIFQLQAPYSQLSSEGRYVPNTRLVDAYQMANGKYITDPTSGFNPRDPYANRDLRLKYSVFLPGDVLPDGKIYNSKPGSGTTDAVGSTFKATNTGFNLEKYINKDDLAQGQNGGLNIIVMRLPEILLTYAEAKIEQNQIDQSVVDAINKIRQRPDVNMPAVTIGSQAEMRTLVRNERLVELSFEGLRLFDIRRWKIAETVMPGKVYGLTYIDNNNALKIVEAIGWVQLFDKSRDYLWPIPQNEIEVNRNLVQNPGW